MLPPQEARAQDDECESCRAGYNLVTGWGGAKSCAAFAGVCTNGVLAEQSRRTHANHCGSCEPGFFLDLVLSVWSCSAYGGVCHMGYLLPQAKRTRHHDCAGCRANHRFSNESKVECIKCAPGHHTPDKTTSTTCSLYGGTCAHGTLADQSLRTQDSQCAVCENGFCLDSTQQCTKCGGECKNGALIEFALRTRHGHCGTCKSGFHLDSTTKDCLAYGGTCAHGLLAAQKTRVREDDCGTCDANHYLTHDHVCSACPKGHFAAAHNTADACVPYAGTCKNGALAEQEVRTENNQCGSCNPGHQLVLGTMFNKRKRCEKWAGSCKHGVLAEQAKRHHANHCGSCQPGFFLELVLSVWSCSAYGGVCHMGYLLPQRERTRHHDCAGCRANHRFSNESKVECIKCTPGHHTPDKTTATTCSPYGGTCSNGKPAKLAHRTVENQCFSCDNGFFMDGTDCKPWAGTCRDGNLVEQERRTADSHCGSCNDGFYLDHSSTAAKLLRSNKVCLPYAGTCRNGNLVPQASRTEHDQCKSCNSGHRLLVELLNSLGGGSKSAPVPARTTKKLCVPCSPGHWSAPDNTVAACTQHKGTCPHGNLAAPELRTQEDHCASCDAGFYLTRQSACKSFGGECSNGKLEEQSRRTHEAHCGTCDDGYDLRDVGTLSTQKSCVPFAGYCTGGTLAAQAARRADNDCGKCTAGYHFDANEHKCIMCSPGFHSFADNTAEACSPYEGQCAHGELKPQEARTQDDDCASCDPGFSLDAITVPSQCKSWDGTCSNGDLIAQSKRTQHNHCGACNGGFYLETQSCVAYAGDCTGGTLAPQEKRAMDNHCGSCFADFRFNKKMISGASVVDSGVKDGPSANTAAAVVNGDADAVPTPISQHECVACSRGYYTAADNMDTTCTPFEGECANGFLEDQAARTKAGHCKNCHVGFFLHRGGCLPMNPGMDLFVIALDNPGHFLAIIYYGYILEYPKECMWLGLLTTALWLSYRVWQWISERRRTYVGTAEPRALPEVQHAPMFLVKCGAISDVGATHCIDRHVQNRIASHGREDRSCCVLYRIELESSVCVPQSRLLGTDLPHDSVCSHPRVLAFVRALSSALWRTLCTPTGQKHE